MNTEELDKAIVSILHLLRDKQVTQKGALKLIKEAYAEHGIDMQKEVLRLSADELKEIGEQINKP